MELVITLLVVGAILLLLETILPGIIAGVVGGCCLLAGIILGYVRFGAGIGTWLLLGVVIGVLAGFWAWIKIFPQSRLGRVLISTKVVGEQAPEKSELLHQAGVAFTQLRPSGTALIQGRRVDVVTEGGLIEKGTPIRVVALEGRRVVVRSTADVAAGNEGTRGS